MAQYLAEPFTSKVDMGFLRKSHFTAMGTAKQGSAVADSTKAEVQFQKADSPSSVATCTPTNGLGANTTPGSCTSWKPLSEAGDAFGNLANFGGIPELFPSSDMEAESDTQSQTTLETSSDLAFYTGDCSPTTQKGYMMVPVIVPAGQCHAGCRTPRGRLLSEGMASLIRPNIQFPIQEPMEHHPNFTPLVYQLVDSARAYLAEVCEPLLASKPQLAMGQAGFTVTARLKPEHTSMQKLVTQGIRDSLLYWTHSSDSTLFLLGSQSMPFYPLLHGFGAIVCCHSWEEEEETPLCRAFLDWNCCAHGEKCTYKHPAHCANVWVAVLPTTPCQPDSQPEA